MAAAARRRGPSRRGHYPRPQGPTHDFLSLSDLSPAQHCCARLGGSAWRPPPHAKPPAQKPVCYPAHRPCPRQQAISRYDLSMAATLPQSKQGRARSSVMFIGSSGPESPFVILAGSRLEGEVAVKLTGAKPLSPGFAALCVRARRHLEQTINRFWQYKLSAVCSSPTQCPGRGAQTGQSLQRASSARSGRERQDTSRTTSLPGLQSELCEVGCHIDGPAGAAAYA